MFIGQRTASTSSSDFSSESIARLVDGAITLAKITSEDPFAGLAEAQEYGKLEGDLHLYFDDVNEMPPAERIEICGSSKALLFTGLHGHIDAADETWAHTAATLQTSLRRYGRDLAPLAECGQ